MSESRENPAPSDLQLREYLLGRLPEGARHALEAAYFEDDELYERLLEMQHDLVDGWARDELTESDRREVESRLLTGPDEARRARAARALARAGDSRAAPRPTVPAVAMSRGVQRSFAAAATVALVAGSAALWLALDNARLRREARPREQSAPTRAAEPVAATRAGSLVTTEVRLNPGVLRNEQPARQIAQPTQAGLVRLLLTGQESAASFTVGIERSGAGRIWTQSPAARAGEDALGVWVPADLLVPGDYEVLLWQGREEPSTLVATYVFRIVSR